MPTMPTTPTDEASSPQERPLRVVVIGAGLAGLMSAIELARAGYRDVCVYEKAERVGGTWRENTYPGVACDVPSHIYSYSFAPNPDWSRMFAPGSEIQAYIERVVQRFELASQLRLGEAVTDCVFEAGQWQLRTSLGRHDHADVVIAATGVTHHPRLPDIPKLSDFTGAVFHSAAWNHDVPLDGRRIGIVGTGSTAVQLVAALVPRVAKLELFQRTAQWIMPLENAEFSPEQRAMFQAHPEKQRNLRASLMRRFAENFSNAVIDVSSPQLRVIEETCQSHLEAAVRDPALRERLRPNYRAACKRLILSSDFYPAIQRANAELVTEGIDHAAPEGLVTRDGRSHALDVLVLATGFRTDRFVRPTRVVGDAGRSLDDVWSTHPTAYLSVAVPGFPNFFLLNGPSSPVGNFSLIEVAELQMAYVLQLMTRLRNGSCREICPSAAAAESFETSRVLATQNTVWTTGCKSWYLDDRGVPASWPWTLEHFRSVMATPDLSAFEAR